MAKRQSPKLEKWKSLVLPAAAWKEARDLADKAVAKHKSTADYIRARVAYYKYGRGILKKLGPHGVVGVSYGPRMRGDVPTEEIAIRVHVTSKKDKELLKKNAKEWGFQKTYGGVGTDIVVWNFEAGAGDDGIGQVHTNGERLEVANSFGTLGTKVVLINGAKRQGVWITAAHLVSPNGDPLSEDVDVFHNGNNIGKVTNANHFHDSRFDVAFIEPNPPISGKTSGRVIGDILDSDQDVAVRKVGAATGAKKGTVKLLDYDGTLTLPTGRVEDVVDHYLVAGVDGEKFAARGDSGALVIKADNTFVGVVRGADQASGIGVITRLNRIEGKDNTKDFRL